MSDSEESRLRKYIFKSKHTAEDVKEILSPLSTAFLEYAYSSEFAGKADELINEHAKSANLKRLATQGNGLEQTKQATLKWMYRHTQYCDDLDSEL